MGPLTKTNLRAEESERFDSQRSRKKESNESREKRKNHRTSESRFAVPRLRGGEFNIFGNQRVRSRGKDGEAKPRQRKQQKMKIKESSDAGLPFRAPATPKRPRIQYLEKSCARVRSRGFGAGFLADDSRFRGNFFHSRRRRTPRCRGFRPANRGVRGRAGVPATVGQSRVSPRTG